MPKTYTHSLPSELVKHVTAICGGPGAAWLEGLPRLIEELETEWAIVTGEPFIKGEFNFVAGAKLESGGDAVLKIAPPYERTEIFAEAEFLRTRDGVGCVRLLAENRKAKALLLERAVPGETMDLQFASDPFACVDPAIDVLLSIQSPRAMVQGDVQYLDDWFTRFERARDTDFPRDHVEKALAIYERLKSQSERQMYIHGDYHPGNIVASGRGGHLAIDPKGLVGNATYDIAVFLNNLHWWQKGKSGIENELSNAVTKFSRAFQFKESTIREAAYAFMVIGAWWSFEDMPDHYDRETVSLADIWEI